MIIEQMYTNKSDEWETPEAFFHKLDNEFHFDLDACASDDNHKCERYFTVADDGLSKNWGGSYSVVQSAI